MTLLPGTQLDRYTIEALLGEGAMGKVYRAFDARLERSVAIKVLENPFHDGDSAPKPPPRGGGFAPDGDGHGAGSIVSVLDGGSIVSVLDGLDASGLDACATRPSPGEGAGEGGDAVASALREARAAAAILHPNATAIFDADRTGDTSFIVMELVPGTSLRRFVGDASVPSSTRVRWLVDVAGALDAAHRAGVIHRDVKPENIIVRDDGLVKVLDFGIARLPRGGAGSFATLSAGGSLVGTPAYMAPEQIRGDDIDGRADQFAWGVLAYELLSGRLPWESVTDPFAMLAAVLSDHAAPLPPAAEVPAEVAAAVLRALSKAPGDRFPSMTEAAAAITAFAGARRPLRRTPAEPPGREGTPPSSIPSGQMAVELGFSEQIAPGARSVAPSPPSRPPPAAAPVDPAMRTLTSGTPRGALLRLPDFLAPVDVDAHLALLPADATCKGIFFIDLARVGATAISPHELFHLAGFPEHRYVAFRDYPAAEYLRLTVAVAMAVHSTLPLGEALRRIGRTAFDTASASLVGKTLFGVYGRDLEPLLFTAPRAYRLFLNFGEVTVDKSAPGTYRFHARDLPAFLETYQIGVIEGVLHHCGARGRLRIALEALDRVMVELELG